MFVTRKALRRRTFLRGMGTSLALPVLDAMWPAFAADAPVSPPRMAFVYTGNGIVHQHWVPTTTGAGFELTRNLQPLAGVRD
jgi:hypothetical protein